MSADMPGGWLPRAIFAFPDAWSAAQPLADKVGAALGVCEVHRFPDGETLVTASPAASLRGQVVALYRSLHDPNTKLVELILAADALRTLGAARLILIAPYMPYMRQDRAFKPGQAVSQMAIGKMLAGVFDGFVTIQPHLHRTSSLSEVFEGKPALALSAGRAIAAHLEKASDPLGIVVGPDEESESLVRDVVGTSGNSWFLGTKRRLGDHEVTIDLPDGLEIGNRPITIVDDIVSSGGTIATLARKLKQRGAGDITVYVAHAMFDQRAAFLMTRAGVGKIRSLSTIPHISNAVPVADLICEGLRIKT